MNEKQVLWLSEIVKPIDITVDAIVAALQKQNIEPTAPVIARVARHLRLQASLHANGLLADTSFVESFKK